MIRIITLLFLVVFLAGCGGDEDTVDQEMESTAMTESAQSIPQLLEGLDAGLQVVSTDSGLQYVDIVVGEGVDAAAGQTVSAHYTGWLLDGTKFDSSLDRGVPIEFPIGVGRVIKGWDEGLGSMKVGGKRRLAIPPELGYGERSAAGGLITPGSTLLFDVELLEVK